MNHRLPADPVDQADLASLPSLDAVDAEVRVGMMGTDLAAALVRAEPVHQGPWRQSIAGHLRHAVSETERDPADSRGPRR